MNDLLGSACLRSANQQGRDHVRDTVRTLVFEAQTADPGGSQSKHRHRRVAQNQQFEARRKDVAVDAIGLGRTGRRASEPGRRFGLGTFRDSAQPSQCLFGLLRSRPTIRHLRVDGHVRSAQILRRHSLYVGRRRLLECGQIALFEVGIASDGREKTQLARVALDGFAIVYAIAFEDGFCFC